MKQRSGSLIDEFFKTLPGHFRDFWLIWFVLAVLLVAAVFACCGQWHVARIIADAGIALLILVFLFYPMTAVYGLIGTSGSVRIFFITCSDIFSISFVILFLLAITPIHIPTIIATATAIMHIIFLFIIIKPLFFFILYLNLQLILQ